MPPLAHRPAPFTAAALRAATKNRLSSAARYTGNELQVLAAATSGASRPISKGDAEATSKGDADAQTRLGRLAHPIRGALHKDGSRQVGYNRIVRSSAMP